jgi:hypothetical protein
MPVHAAAHVGRFVQGFFQRFKDGDGIDVLAGNGRADVEHFGPFLRN